MSKINLYHAYKEDVSNTLKDKMVTVTKAVDEATNDFKDGIVDLSEFLDSLTDICYEHFSDIAFVYDLFEEEELFDELMTDCVIIDSDGGTHSIDQCFAIIDVCKKENVNLDTHSLERFCKNLEIEKQRINNSMELLEIEEEK